VRRRALAALTILVRLGLPTGGFAKLPEEMEFMEITKVSLR
jgi:hypothetical protein